MHSEDSYNQILHIPEGISFDCTGCGNCCFKWPVPATAEDVRRIESLHAGSSLKSQPKFSKLGFATTKLNSFTHVLGKDEKGRCQYLDELSCRLHTEFGAGAKPAMCQLFPYTFTVTPSGAYASLSFASTGVLLNHGTPLTEQKELLEDRLALFLKLFPIHPDWSTIQAIDGKPLNWAEYTHVEAQLIAKLHTGSIKSLNSSNVFECSRLIIDTLKLPDDLENEKLIPAQPSFLDAVLFKLVYEMYFPEDAFAEGRCDFDTTRFLDFMRNQKLVPSVEFGGKQFTTEQLSGITGSAMASPAAELLSRFVYCRLFAKLYFGPGFGGLSLISGFHHLLLLTAMLRVRLKMRISAAISDDPLDGLREDLRTMERRLTVTDLSQPAHATLEVLLQGPQRLRRMILLAE